ncbi:MAG: glycosyltransferase family 4 protein [Acetobacteraceae bacterium]|nr:glycosyltransferase family 4 protein [Acetobacteraceae bacterium]
MGGVLFVSHVGELGGAEHGLLHIARHFGSRCHVVLFDDGPVRQRLQQAGIGVTVLAAYPLLLGVRKQGRAGRALASAPEVLRLAWRLARIARGYEVLYPNSQKAAVIAMVAARIVGRRVVWHLRDILLPDHFAALQRTLVVRLANATAHRVIANSEATKASFIACGGNPALVRVVLNGVDESEFEGIERFDAAAMRRSLGLERVKLVGLFGRISPWKGQHVLIQALAELPDVHAIMVGEALFGETKHREQLRAHASRLGVVDRVHWLGFRTDLPQLMRAVDVVVHASTLAEPFGRVIVEGMMAKRPVLASDAGATRELLGDEYAGLVPPGDPRQLAAAINRMLAMSPEQVETITERNDDRARRLFSLRRMLQDIEDVVGLAA